MELVNRWKKQIKRLAALLLAMLMLAACSSGAISAANVSEKIELGQKYLTELNYSEAVAAFTEVIELDPSNIEAYMGRAKAYVGLKQYDDAKSDYTTVIEKAEELPYTQAQAYAGRAEVNDLTDQTEAAESDYTAAIELLEEDDVAEKENVEIDLITALKIKILQLHAEICMRLGLYDKAMADYAKLEELGVDMTSDQEGQNNTQANQMGGAYNWYYTSEDGTTIKMLVNVQAGKSQIDAVADYASAGMTSEDIVEMIALYKIMNEYPELQTAQQEFQRIAEAGSSLSAAIDQNNLTDAQMAQWSALAAQMEALQTKYSGAYEAYDREIEKVAAVNWRPQFVETFTMSNPVSRVEKTSDTLYVYVPTGTRFVNATMTFASYSGSSESIDLTGWMKNNSKTDLSKPIYEWGTNGDATGSFKIEYKEDKK